MLHRLGYPSPGSRTWVERWVPARLRASQFGRRVAVLAGSAALGRALAILAAPLLTRLYDPEEFGLLAVYVALVGLVSGVICLRYEVAIPLPKSDRSAANLVVLSLAIAGAMALAVGLLLPAISGPLTDRLNVPGLAPYLWLLPLGLFAVGVYQTLNYWAVRKQAFWRIGRTRIAQGVGQVGVQVGWGLGPGGPLGLLLGAIIGEAAGLTTLATGMWRGDRRAFAAVRWRALKRVAVRYRRFPLLAGGAAVLNSGVRILPALLLAALYGPQVAGWYALGQRVVAAPLRLLGGAVAQVYLGHASALARRGDPALAELFTRVTVRLLLIGIVPLGTLMVAGPWLFEIVFGQEWGEAGRYVQFMSVAFLAQFVVGPTSPVLFVIERQGLHMIWDVVSLLVLLGIFYSAATFVWAPLLTIGVYSVSLAIGFGVLFVMVHVALRNHRRKSSGA